MAAPKPDFRGGDEMIARVRAGDRRALAKAITLIESTHPDHAGEARALLASLLPHGGGAVRIGISGVPGVGKSTFIDAFGMYLLSLGKKVAVLAIDPSSERSGGSILGDKARMPRLAAAECAFVRPSPTRGLTGGVAPSTCEVLSLCEAAGFDVVLVETVGVGQSEYVLAGMVDVFVLLLLPGAGDELQAMKRGILEVADVVAITKADGDNKQRAEQSRVQYRAGLRLLRGGTPDQAVEVVLVSSLEGAGLDRVWQLILQHCNRLASTGALEEKRRAQRTARFMSLLRDGLWARFLSRPSARSALDTVKMSVEQGDVTPGEGAASLLASLLS